MITRQTLVTALGLMTVGLTSCMNDLTDPSEGKAEENDQQIIQYIQNNNFQDRAQRQQSGLYVVTYPNPQGPFAGTGATIQNPRRPATGDEVTFRYRLYLLNGNRVIDSTATGRPAQFPFGVRLMLPGLEEGLSLLNEGQQATLLMPYFLGFGGQDSMDSTRKNVIVPAFSPVRFDVQLLRTRNEETQINEYVLGNRLTVRQTTPTGIRIISGMAASGDTIGPNKTVRLKYTGRLLRGNKQFDSGEFEFKTGTQEAIQGFSNGVQSLKRGEKATLIFPSSQGYGPRGSVRPGDNFYTIPPYAPLRFDVEILEVK